MQRETKKDPAFCSFNLNRRALTFGTKLDHFHYQKQLQSLVGPRSQNFQFSFALLEIVSFHGVNIHENESTFKSWDQIGPIS